MKLAQHFTKTLTWIWDERHSERPWVNVLSSLPTQPSFALSGWLLLIWCAYVLGAAMGACGSTIVALRPLIIAIAALGLLIIMDVQTPLATADEEQQAES